MRKSQIECQLDKQQRKTAEAAAAETAHMEEMTAGLDSVEHHDTKTRWEDCSHLDWLNIVSQAAQMARMQWQDVNALNAMRFPAVSHLKHSLQIGDDFGHSPAMQRFNDTISNTSAPSMLRNLAAGITTDFPRSTLEDWRAMQKSARDQQRETCKDVNNSEFNLDVNTYCLNPALGTLLEPRISAIDHQPTHSISDVDVFTQTDDCCVLVDSINRVLPLNFLQRLIVEGVMHHVIGAKNKPPCVDLSDQMLLYVRGAGRVGKSQVIKAIEIGFFLLQQRDELLITAPTGAAASGIGRSTVHAAMEIKIPGRISAAPNSNVWTRRTSLVVDEVSMISLKLLASMDSKIRLAKGDPNNSTALFGGLLLVIFLGNFFQFTPVGEKPLWDERHWLHTKDEKIGRQIWKSFRSVLTLTEQMRQSSDPEFKMLLTRARNAELNHSDVDTLNSQVATELLSNGSLDEAVIMQENSSCHLTNCISADILADSLGQDIVLFPCHISRNKKDGNEIVRRDEIYAELDSKSITGPGLVSFLKGMPATVLSNSCTMHQIVNGTRAIMHSVVADPLGER